MSAIEELEDIIDNKDSKQRWNGGINDTWNQVRNIYDPN